MALLDLSFWSFVSLAFGGVSPSQLQAGGRDSFLTAPTTQHRKNLGTNASLPFQLLLYTTSLFLYNILLSPLASSPRPVPPPLTRLPLTYHLLTGTLPPKILALHKQYGPVVRIAPDE